MIHPTAVVDKRAQLGIDVEIGPYSVVGPDVILEDHVRLGAHVVVEGDTRIGSKTVVSSFASLGHPPQDIHYAGEATKVEVGSGCAIREYVSIHRGTPKGGGLTRVGDHCMVMAYAHIAHDCRVGDHVIMANATTLAGHVEVQDFANIGGLTAVHQFARIGQYAFVGGASAISMDVVPFASAAGNRARITGVNVVGMRRGGFSEEVIKLVRQAHRTIFRSNLRLEEAIEEVSRRFSSLPEIESLLEFLQTGQRGICR
ncbi:MAG: acyl-ACP--UDP-N-acetylglucosamine O-acyltransferase [Magnetococcales bacterium]|nr:acyl-ACP--UDP-N-acetylglucosamine O-acyltransferase [Magnetococcales bacterium]MBF0155967.1 acyl-ACP--UDP-N-acetylglucosamine O-acyltransferase [Magnetococcales bacterium]